MPARQTHLLQRVANARPAATRSMQRHAVESHRGNTAETQCSTAAQHTHTHLLEFRRVSGTMALDGAALRDLGTLVGSLLRSLPRSPPAAAPSAARPRHASPSHRSRSASPAARSLSWSRCRHSTSRWYSTSRRRTRSRSCSRSRSSSDCRGRPAAATATSLCSGGTCGGCATVMTRSGPP
jgi:hypothetical protein